MKRRVLESALVGVYFILFCIVLAPIYYYYYIYIFALTYAIEHSRQ